MVAGISGASPGSAGGGDPEDIGPKLMPPPHAPSKTVSAEAAARLATVRALRELIIAFPRAIAGRCLTDSLAAPVKRPMRNQAQKACRSNDLRQNYAAAPIWFPNQHPILASPRP
jgi:hypothetical protein